MPWPLIKGDLEPFAQSGLKLVSFDDFIDEGGLGQTIQGSISQTNRGKAMKTNILSLLLAVATLFIAASAQNQTPSIN